VNKLVSAVVMSVLLLGAGSGHAATRESKAAAVESVTQPGKVVGVGSVLRKAGQTLDIGGTHIFAVLGGGLIAVSLLARRKSS
jgi:hypothetical protein